MSNARYSILPARAVFDGRLSAMELRVLAALGTYSDNEGWCFPSQKTLTERLDCSRSSVGAAIKKLVEIGYVQVRARTSKGKGKVGNEYRVDTTLPPQVEAERPMSKSPDIGYQVIEVTPMCGGLDIGADVQLAGQPMSNLPDIGIYNALTTPSERPHCVLGKEPKTQSCANGVSRKPAKAKRAREVYPEAFQTLWLMWPRPRRELSDKRKAFERWQDGLKVWPEEIILRAAKMYLAKPDVKKENFKYCRLAQVFLNGGLEAAIEAAQDSKPRRVWSTNANAWIDA